jgi:hypothetical protein
MRSKKVISKIKIITSSLMLFSLTSCSLGKVNQDLKLSSSSGSVLIARVAPQISNLDESNYRALGFLPLPEPENRSAHIDLKNNFIRINGKNAEYQIINSSLVIPSGSYTVLLKQQNPTWYAPDSYYQLRKLPVPPLGSKDRYLRGALGKHAIFLDNNLILHDTRAWSDEVGGVQLESQTLQELFEVTNVEDKITVNQK